MRRLIVVGALVLAGAGAGCGGSSDRPGGEQGPETGARSAKEDASQTEKGSSNPMEAPGEYVGAVLEAKERAEGVMGLSELKKAIERFRASEGRLPNDLQELTEEDYLAELPSSPGNTGFDYNPETGQVTVSRH